MQHVIGPCCLWQIQYSSFSSSLEKGVVSYVRLRFLDRASGRKENTMDPRVLYMQARPYMWPYELFSFPSSSHFLPFFCFSSSSFRGSLCAVGGSRSDGVFPIPIGGQLACPPEVGEPLTFDTGALITQNLGVLAEVDQVCPLRTTTAFQSSFSFSLF